MHLCWYIDLILPTHRRHFSRGERQSVKIERFDKGDIDDSLLVKVVEMGHLVEVQYVHKRNSTMPITVLSKDNYIENSTGEIKEFIHSDNRAQQKESLRRTFKNLRYLINNNFFGNPNELFLTLTYAENMTDPKILKRNFDDFIKSLRRKFKKDTTIDFINVVEPQARGAWHCHVLLRFNDLDTIFIPKEKLSKIWGHGFVDIQSVEGVDNIGAYLSAYLSDIDIEDVSGCRGGESLNLIKDESGNVKKAYIKGGRLSYYPPGMNIYRCSKGIKKPTEEFMTHSDIKKIVGSAQPHYSTKYVISDNDKVVNTVIYNQYNLKRQ